MRKLFPSLHGLLTAALILSASVSSQAQLSDVTQPGDPIIPSSSRSPGSEGVANAIDNQPTKYLNFDSGRDGTNSGFSPSGFVVSPAVGNTHVTGIALTSANDAPERDPRAFTLEGSNDDTISAFNSGNWTLIASISGIPSWPSIFGGGNTNRFKTQTFTFPNAKAYRHYRWIVTETQTTPNGCCMQIAEVEFLGTTLPRDVTQPGDTIFASSSRSPGSEGVANAIDNQPTKYLNFDSGRDGTNSGFSPSGFAVSPSIGRTLVNAISMQSANDAVERDPKTVTLEGSNDPTLTGYDSVTWEPITTISNIPSWPSIFGGGNTNRFKTQTFFFNNPKPYRHYRWVVTETQTTPNGCCMQIAEVELLGTSAPRDVTQPGDPIFASSSRSPGSEGVANAIDDQPTKYLNFDSGRDGTNSGFSPSGFAVSPRIGATTVIGLTMQSANDAPERDPRAVTLEGSNDDTISSYSSGTWEVITVINNIPSWPSIFGGGNTNRFKTQEFFFSNSKSYKHYRWTVTETQTTPNGCCMQIAEVEFLAVPQAGNTNIIDTLIRRQPKDTPVLLGAQATFRVLLTGPWNVQWYKNGAAIPGAIAPSYTTPATTAGDDGALFKAVVSSPQGTQVSDQVMLSIFTPSTTESIGLSWRGSGANGAPTDMLPTDITGFAKQAYWNNLTGGGGTLANPINSSNAANPTITVNWTTSGEWGVGTGNQDATERMFNGMCTTIGENQIAKTVTFSGVPPGNHSLFLYTVQVPLEFYNMDFAVVTHDSGGNDVVQRRYIRPLNADEYNAFPGFFLVPSETPETRGVGSMMRFDNLVPGPDGVIQIQFLSPRWVDLPGGDPSRGPGLNAVQLCLNPAPAGAPPVITRQPVSANGIVGGCITLSAEAIGPGLTYQWYKDGRAIPGATTPNLTVANLNTNSPGSYIVVVSNPAGNVRSSIAVVEVLTSNQLTLGLVAEFKLDDAGGATAANSAPGGQNGQVRGSTPTAVPGQIGNALAFNGADNYIYVPNYTKVNKAMTVSGWAQPFLPGPLVNNWVEGQLTGSSGQFLVDLVDDGTGVLTVRAQIEVGPNRVLATAPLPDPSQTDPFTWHHFAASANGINLSLYWDGQFLGSVDYLGTINSTPSLPWLSIGAALNTGQTPDPAITPNLFSGNLDDIALWNRSLGGSEIQALYSGGLAGQDVSQVPPVLTPGTCPPTINCSPNITAECTGGLTPVTFDVTATDTSGNAVPVICVPPSGTGFRLGSSNVICTATVANQSSSCSFRVTVVDTTPPSVTCNSNITANATSANGAVVSYTAGASDPCGIASLVCLPAGGTFPIGTTTVTCVAIDTVGNSNSCSFTVTVLVGDTTPPTVTCPANITADATSAAGAVVTYIAAASDAGGIASFACVPPSGSTFPIGVTTVTCTATDLAGNSASCSFTITVRSNNQPPTAVISTEQLVNIPGIDHPVLISCNWWNACLVADGWSSSDPEGGALTYLWFLEPDPLPFAAGPVVTNCLEVGEHTITLVVTDPTGLTGTDSKTIEVVTAPLGIELLIEEVNSGSLKSAISRKIKRELTETLRVALDFAGDNKLRQTQNALDAFEKKVRAQVAPNYPAEATKWIRWSQAVSEGMEKCIKPPRKHGDDEKKDTPPRK